MNFRKKIGFVATFTGTFGLLYSLLLLCGVTHVPAVAPNDILGMFLHQPPILMVGALAGGCALLLGLLEVTDPRDYA